MRGWKALAYDGSKQLFAPSAEIPEAERENGITIPVPRPDDAPGQPGEYFQVRLRLIKTMTRRARWNFF
jgi:hypothetical protein